MLSSFCIIFSVKQGIWALSIIASGYTIILTSLDFLVLARSSQNARKGTGHIIAGGDWLPYDFILRTFRLDRSQYAAVTTSAIYMIIFPFLALCGVIGTYVRKRGMVSRLSKALWCYLALTLPIKVFMLVSMSSNTFAQDCIQRTSEEEECKNATRFFINLRISGTMGMWAIFLYYCLLVRAYVQQLEKEHEFQLRLEGDKIDPPALQGGLELEKKLVNSQPQASE